MSRVGRRHVVPPEHVYPTHDWKIIEKRFFPRFLAQTETLFALSNGFLGLRGDFEEGAPVAHGGAFLNGFYESWPIVYGEQAYGFARTGQTIVNVPDGKLIKLFVDDEPFEPAKAHLLEFERTLDMQAGILGRDVLWETPSGKRIRLSSRRIASIQRRHLALISYEVTVENADAYVLVASELRERPHRETGNGDPRRARGFGGRVLVPSTARAEQGRVTLCFQTRNSGLRLSCAMDHRIETECDYRIEREAAQDSTRVVFQVEAKRGEPFRIDKFITYHHSDAATAEDLATRAERTLDRALCTGPERLFAEQAESFADFWERADVQVEADGSAQQAIRFNLFQLFQATARVAGFGMPAKGLTGQGYEGHYFWDGEIYVLPFLIYTAPRTARSLLQFRYQMLDKARARAAELGHAGAMYPWRTINGEEASAYYASGTAQYHINADIAYAVRKYYQITGDIGFLLDGGAEMLVETARLWADLGFYSPMHDGAFCINGVTGPDEYTAVVDNNCFTNMMARENLRTAVNFIEFISQRYPDDLVHLVEQTGLQPSEPEEWLRAAEQMFLPIDEKTGIHPQDDSFLEQEPWDFEHTPPEKYPLLLHYHPLVLYRHQVIKQADVVMAMFLLGSDFSTEEKKRNFDYYDPITTHDSSLSSCIQSILASELGYAEKAVDLFMEAVLVDLADIAGNVIDGVHVASMGGAWMALVYGFGGMRDDGGQLSFRPRLPKELRRLRFPLTIRGQRLEVDVRPEGTTYLLREGTHLLIEHEGEPVDLDPGGPVFMPKA